MLTIASIATIFTTLNGGSHSATKASTAYWANERQMIAIWDGFRTSVETQENRKAGQAPNASIKYAHSAPEDVFIVPNSAYANAPNNESNPQAIHIIKLTPMEPVRTSKPDGDTKIPDPIIVPTIKATPLKSPTRLWR